MLSWLAVKKVKVNGVEAYVLTILAGCGYGAKLTNTFSKSFVIDIADGCGHRKTYHQKVSNNMEDKSEAKLDTCEESPNWTKLTFKPDLAKFKMKCLEEDIVTLMHKRVLDVAVSLGKDIEVKLNSKSLCIKSFNVHVIC